MLQEYAKVRIWTMFILISLITFPGKNGKSIDGLLVGSFVEGKPPSLE